LKNEGKARPLWAISFLCALALTGCGGGGSNGGFLTRALNLNIRWDPTTKAVISPDTAQSGSAVLTGGAPDEGDLTLLVDRGTAAPGSVVSYRFPQEVRVGGHHLTVTFFSEPHQQGVVVGIANTDVVIGSNSFEIPTVDVTTDPNTSIAKVVLNPGQTVAVGQSKALTFTATNGNGEVIALPPPATVPPPRPGVSFAVTAGQDRLQINTNEQATGLNPGVALVTVTVDGITSSPPQTVTVTSNTTVAISPTSTTLAVGGTQQFTKTVTNQPAGASTAVTWSVQESNGGSITADGLYTAPQTRGTFHVIATSQYDPTKTAVATVSVQAGSATGTIQ
jgi:hypothetical protein